MTSEQLVQRLLQSMRTTVHRVLVELEMGIDNVERIVQRAACASAGLAGKDTVLELEPVSVGTAD